MNRVDNLQENALVERVTMLRAQMDQIKTTQLTGSTSIQMNRVVTGANADITTTLTYNVYQIWEITYTPLQQPFANSAFLWRIFVDVVSLTGSSLFDNFTENIPSSGSVQTFRLYLMGRASGLTTTLNLRIVMYAIGAGTISVVQIV